RLGVRVYRLGAPLDGIPLRGVDDQLVGVFELEGLPRLAAAGSFVHHGLPADARDEPMHGRSDTHLAGLLELLGAGRDVVLRAESHLFETAETDRKQFGPINHWPSPSRTRMHSLVSAPNWVVVG